MNILTDLTESEFMNPRNCFNSRDNLKQLYSYCWPVFDQIVSIHQTRSYLSETISWNCALYLLYFYVLHQQCSFLTAYCWEQLCGRLVVQLPVPANHTAQCLSFGLGLCLAVATAEHDSAMISWCNVPGVGFEPVYKFHAGLKQSSTTTSNKIKTMNLTG